MPDAAALLAASVAVSFVLISAALVLSFTRLLRGPSLADRVVALDLIGYLAVGFVVLVAIASDEPAFLDAAITLALIAFVGTVAFARYIESTSDAAHLPPLPARLGDGRDAAAAPPDSPSPP